MSTSDARWSYCTLRLAWYPAMASASADDKPGLDPSSSLDPCSIRLSSHHIEIHDPSDLALQPIWDILGVEKKPTLYFQSSVSVAVQKPTNGQLVGQDKPKNL